MMHAIEILEERQCRLRQLIRTQDEFSDECGVAFDVKQYLKQFAEVNEALTNLKAIEKEKKHWCVGEECKECKK